MGGGSSGAAPPSIPRGMMVKSSVIKEIPEAELKKHKVRDIMAFIKAGNLPMVHGLVNYFGIGHGVVAMRGIAEDFVINKQKVKMSEWNPVLLAVAFKRVEIVRYFVHDLKISMRVALRDPMAGPLEDH